MFDIANAFFTAPIQRITIQKADVLVSSHNWIELNQQSRNVLGLSSLSRPMFPTV